MKKYAAKHAPHGRKHVGRKKRERNKWRNRRASTRRLTPAQMDIYARATGDQLGAINGRL